LLFARVARHDYHGHFLLTSIYSGCGVTLVFTSHLLVAFSFALALPPSLLQFAFELRALLVEAMEGEGSSILDIVGDVWKVPLPEISMTSSSSDDSSGGAASDDAEGETEDTIVMDPRKSTWSYDFWASSITVGRICVDVSYAAPQAHGIINVALHREYSPGIVFIFSKGMNDLYHI
jgi:hypothetical protein